MDLYNSTMDIDSNGVNYNWKGDYLGFTFGGIHSSSLGIVRVSDSDRYNEDLKPNDNDITATVSGLDATYYFGTTYTQKNFTIKFAFDHLNDSQIRKLRRVFSDKKPQDLIFDENPYKVYTVKVKDIPNLSYLCFDSNDDESERIYKGEGAVNFIAYSPFAKSRFKYLEDYNIENIPEWGGIVDNKMEWLKSSGIVSKDTKYTGSYYHSDGDIDVPTEARIQLYNPGDIETSPVIICNTGAFFPSINVTINKKKGTIPTFVLLKNYSGNIPNSYPNSDVIGFLSLDKTKITEEIKSILIDSKKHLIYASKKNILQNDNSTEDSDNMVVNSVEDFMTKGEPFIFNQCIYAGDFFNIPVTENTTDSIVIGVLNPPQYGSSNVVDKILIFYDYLYY